MAVQMDVVGVHVAHAEVERTNWWGGRIEQRKKNFCLQLLNDIGEELINGVGVVVAKLSFQW